MDLSGRVAIVTGASSGIGEATARELARAGAHVALAARRLDRLIATASEIGEQDGGNAIAVECDVRDASQVESLVIQTLKEFGQIDALINNAGVMPLSPIARLHVDDWHEMVDINITGVLNGVASVLPHMLERGSGHIINVSSVAGRLVFPGAAVYCGTKHFVHAFSDGLRAELGQKGIRVTIVAPGYVATELQAGIRDDRTREGLLDMYKDVDVLQSEDIARGVMFAMTQPEHVGINEILVRPTQQLR